MSYYYAAPIYVGISALLCLSYSCIECTKDNGNLDNSSKTILSVWSISSLIVASIVAAVSSEMMIGSASSFNISIMIILICLTLSISCSMIYWA